ncbi:MAG: pentapeptide repeat-containing protein [Pseudanabaenaceae cyanobacterium bins.68]|nr:pentapeptide repeat-containing protein [Pseudanabaenaceae cyanobacterium bins.68]
MAKVLKLVWVCVLLVFLGAGQAWAEDYDKQVLTGMDFSDKNLQGSQFNKTILRRTKFVHAKLKGVSLFGADMSDADFREADLSFATLDTARMDYADLTNANLEGAFAYGTSFRKVKIEGADFTEVDLRDNVRQELCAIASGTNPLTGRDTRVSLECE